MKDLNHDELQIKVTESGGTIEMKWLGKSRNPDPSSFLLPYLDGVINDLKEGSKITVNFKELAFMNSSTVTSIINFVKNLDKKNIATEIFFLKDKEWQAACFKALETIVLNSKNISVKGE